VDIKDTKMARPLPKEIREAIVNAYEHEAGTIPEVAAMFNITSRTVSNYLRIHRETGDLTPRPKSGRPAILNDNNLAIIKKIILSNNDGTLQEYCDAFKKETKIEVTIVTMHNACEKLKIRRKKRVITRKKEIV
jgi:transposase